ncbi:MAG: acyl-CoA dehydrogenase family protein [Candidatus Eremiobacteraeota bacterium]|nr:acyl-CoA dehydrogenase family protein [Candidatus Eremiobacteraeota bacterium]
MGTHEVSNQPQPLEKYNLFGADHALREAADREGAIASFAQLEEIGRLAGSSQAIAWGFEANENPPKLHTHDRFGNRIDEVTFHPSYHRLLETATSFGLHGSPWQTPPPGAHVARAAGFFLWAQVEAGHGCPISMTYAAIPVMRSQPNLSAIWEPKLTAKLYDPRLVPVAEKAGALCGMAMTEKQGGSDVRANQSRASFDESGSQGDVYRITGHKWFCSAPMSDAFLTLAQTDAGLTCFFMPRVLPDGTRNVFRIQRLKDKLGNRSNASSEIELENTYALLVGEAGQGIQTIVEMVNYTRLDCINGSAALMRQAVAQAIHHCTYRHAFGSALRDQPLMQNVLADLALESEAATLLLMRLAGAVDRAQSDPREAALKRLGTAIGKFWVCKRAPIVVNEALESLGGNGYVEESILPRLYREAPLNSIWEGSGNINALDVLRIIAKQPDALAAYFSEISPALEDPLLRAAADALATALHDNENRQSQARRLVEQMALLWQASLLHQHSPLEVSRAFTKSRLGGDWGRTFGSLRIGAGDARAIIDHAAVSPR